MTNSSKLRSQKVLKPIYVTDDLSIFTPYRYNRNTSHYKKIRRSIETNGSYLMNNPIAVYEDGVVADGNGRCLAADDLKLPIAYFIVEDDCPIDEFVLHTNEGRTNWSITNYIQSGLKRGIQGVYDLVTLSEATDLTPTAICKLLSVSKAKLIDKDFSITPSQEERVTLAGFIFNTIAKTTNPVGNKSILLESLRWPPLNINKKRLERKFQKYGYVWQSRGNAEEYKLQIMKIYNYGNRTSNHKLWQELGGK